MVKSSKTGRELTPQRGRKVPARVRRFFEFLGIRPPESPADEGGDESDT